MRTEMSKAEAITRIDRFLSYLEKIYTPQCDYDEALIRKDDITAFVIARDALKEQRPHGEWIDRSDGGRIRYPFWERYECSKCGAKSENTNFCPNCGADNRPREEENNEAYLPFDLSAWEDEDNGGCQENVIDTDDFINEIGADLNGF